MNFLEDLFATIADRGRRLIELPGAKARPGTALEELCRALMSETGEASGIALAAEILAAYRGLDDKGKTAFFHYLAEAFNPDPEAVLEAAEHYRDDGGPASLASLVALAEPPRQELLRRINFAPGATAALVAMRGDLLDRLREEPALDCVDADFRHLFNSWFNRGFLCLQRIDWSTPANVLEKIIRYEAVHAITDWEDLRQRVDPCDRRCYAFFHPALVDEPLIFLEVALTAETPSSIQALLYDVRELTPPDEATTAAFYSISNCQRGLRNVSFGNFLIKQVVEELRRELPGLKAFVTLSPLPGFADWVRSGARDDDDTVALRAAAERGDMATAGADDEVLKSACLRLGAQYLLREKTRGGRPRDPVAGFHLGNGASVERLDWLADTSPAGMTASFGLMVNYRYDPATIEANHETFLRDGTISAARAVRGLLPKA